ncbi:hypothetical protein FOLKNPGA_01906 [Legionella sp. PC1000]|nr:hypothetical protein FOLKNPGA_01906 [Legionella sp. PC1000]
MPSSNPIPLQSHKNILLLALLIAVLIYLLEGPLASGAFLSTITITAIQSRKKWDSLLRKAVEAEDSSALSELKKQQIELTFEQKLKMLCNAYHLDKKEFIYWLEQQQFKVSISEIFSIFKQNKDKNFLRLCIERFSSLPSQASLRIVLKELLVSNDHIPIDSLLNIYPKEVLKGLSKLSQYRKELLDFIVRNKHWLTKNSDIVWGIFPNLSSPFPYDLYRICYPEDRREVAILLYELKKSQPNKAFCLILVDELDTNITAITDLEKIIKKALKNKQEEIAIYLINRMGPILKRTPELANSLLFENVRNPMIAELLIANGADVNSMKDGVSVGERAISWPRKRRESQNALNLLLKHRINLAQEVNDKPHTATRMTLLGFLPFTNLKIKSSLEPELHKAVEANRYQKFISLFLEIPGESRSNENLCHHSYMQDSYVFWNFLLNLYFKMEGQPHGVAPASKNQFLDCLNNCLKRLYTKEGDFDSVITYDCYQQFQPVVLPVILSGRSHIATVGFMKVSPNFHVSVEADRSDERHDFSVFISRPHDPAQFSKYTATYSRPLPIAFWQTHSSPSIFYKDLAPQTGAFCPAISAKHAFFIAHFLSVVKQQIAGLEESTIERKLSEILNNSYKVTTEWFNQFFISVKRMLLEGYQQLDSKYINYDFLALAEKATNMEEEKLISEQFPLSIKLS